MKNRVAIIYFWSLTFTFQVYASISDNNLAELKDNSIENFYVGPIVDERKTIGCIKNFLPWFHRVEKCQLEDTSLFLKEYVNNKEALISQGFDGEVRMFVRPSDSKQVAVKKMLRKDASAYCEYLNEVKMLQKFKGKHITADIYCTFKDNEGFFYYMMEYLPGRTLAEANFYNPKKENFNVKWADLCSKMASIIKMVNDMGVVHLDAHLRNWMVTEEGRLYLIDFSRSKRLNGNQSKEVASLGVFFRDVQNKMLMILGQFLKIGWDSITDLREQVGQYADIEGIRQIIDSMVVDEDTPNLKKIILALDSFKKMHEKS